MADDGQVTRYGDGASRSSDGVDRNRTYPFDDFCAILGIRGAVKSCLLDALQLAGRSEKWIDYGPTCQQVEAGWALFHLSTIGDQVEAARKEQTIRKNKQRKNKK